MGRKRIANYTEVAKQMLQELGGGPVRSGDLVRAVIDKGLVPDTKYIYNHLLRAVRESSEFNTSLRGYVSLGEATDTTAPSTAAVAS